MAKTSSPQKITSLFESAFAQSKPQSTNAQLHSILQSKRDGAWKRLVNRELPSQKQEEWRYSRLAFLKKQKFSLCDDYKSTKPLATCLSSVTQNLSEYSAHLVFINGYFSLDHSTLPQSELDLHVAPLSKVIKDKPQDVLRALSNNNPLDQTNPFTDLNLSFLQDGTFISVANEQKVVRPVAITHLLDGPNNQSSFPRNIICVGTNSDIVIEETFHSLSDDKSVAIPALNIDMKDNAKLAYYLQTKGENSQANHIHHLEAHLARNCELEILLLTQDRNYARHDAQIFLNGEGSSAKISGFYHGKKAQIFDQQIQMIHNASYTSSMQTFKGMIDDEAQGIYRGKIIIPEGKRKVSAQQLNKNLLLSSDATVCSQPILEILSDDVKCSHGSTVSQLRDEEVFYLKSRGIAPELAQLLLSQGFALSLLPLLENKTLKTIFEKEITDSLKKKNL